MQHFYRLEVFSFLLILFLPVICSAQLEFDQRFDLPLSNDGGQLEMPWIGGLNSSIYNRLDLDGDGNDELVLYDRSGHFFQIFQRDGETLQAANELCVLLPELDPGWILFVDFDLDGKKDLFAYGERGVVVYRNTAQNGEAVSWQKRADPLLTTGFSGKINLIVNAADVPAITDIDGDGDVDILVYNFAIGGYIRYNQNLSVELFGNADSLEYAITTRRWGEFEECDCNLFAFNGETCEDVSNGRVQHAGGKALLAFDNDGDGDMDLLGGHEQCIELYFFENMGDADSAYMTGYSDMFPDDVNPSNFYIFPAGFYEDLDFDGVKDLMVTPSFEENYLYGINFAQSNWYYRNVGSNDNPDFQYQESDFLQGDMLDLGENAVPTFIDLDADGNSDLIVAANGNWNGDNYSGFVVELSHNGDPENPAYERTSSDYLGLSSLNLINPAINLADADADGVVDLIYSGIRFPNELEAWLIMNQAETGLPANFDVDNRIQIMLPESMVTRDHPTFVDIDEDGQVDLLVGKQNGALEYHRNSGSFSFSLEDPAFLGIDRDFSLERRNTVASVIDIEQNDLDDLIVSDSRGIGFVYFDFKVEATAQPIELVYQNNITSDAQQLKFDQKSWVAGAHDVLEDSLIMVVGGVRGGLQLFGRPSEGDNSNGVPSFTINLYPNPIGDPNGLNIVSNQNATMEVISVLGQLMIEPFEVSKFTTTNLDVAHMRNGTYILRSESENGGTTSQLFMILR